MCIIQFMLFLWCCYKFCFFFALFQRVLLNRLSKRKGKSCRFWCSCRLCSCQLCCSCPSAPDLLVPPPLVLLLLLLDIEALTMRLWESLCQVIQKETGRYGDGILEAGQELRRRGPIQGETLHDLPEVPELGHTPDLLPDAGGYALMILLQSVSF
jgi:hypothetical protein